MSSRKTPRRHQIWLHVLRRCLRQYADESLTRRRRSDLTPWTISVAEIGRSCRRPTCLHHRRSPKRVALAKEVPANRPPFALGISENIAIRIVLAYRLGAGRSCNGCCVSTELQLAGKNFADGSLLVFQYQQHVVDGGGAPTARQGCLHPSLYISPEHPRDHSGPCPERHTSTPRPLGHPNGRADSDLLRQSGKTSTCTPPD